MNRGELDLLVVAILGLLLVLGFDVCEQRHLREKFIHAFELLREDGELFQVVEARSVVGKVRLKVIVVAGFDDERNNLCCALAVVWRFQL